MSGAISQATPPGGFPAEIAIHAADGAFVLRVNKNARVYETMADLSRDIMPRVRQELIAETIFKGSC